MKPMQETKKKIAGDLGAVLCTLYGTATYPEKPYQRIKRVADAVGFDQDDIYTGLYAAFDQNFHGCVEEIRDVVEEALEVPNKTARKVKQVTDELKQSSDELKHTQEKLTDAIYDFGDDLKNFKGDLVAAVKAEKELDIEQKKALALIQEKNALANLAEAKATLFNDVKDNAEKNIEKGIKRIGWARSATWFAGAFIITALITGLCIYGGYLLGKKSGFVEARDEELILKLRCSPNTGQV